MADDRGTVLYLHMVLNRKKKNTVTIACVCVFRIATTWCVMTVWQFRSYMLLLLRISIWDAQRTESVGWAAVCVAKKPLSFFFLKRALSSPNCCRYTRVRAGTNS